MHFNANKSAHMLCMCWCARLRVGMCKDMPLCTGVMWCPPLPPTPPQALVHWRNMVSSPPLPHSHRYTAAAVCLQKTNLNLPSHLMTHEQLECQDQPLGWSPFQTLHWPVVTRQVVRITHSGHGTSYDNQMQHSCKPPAVCKGQ